MSGSVRTLLRARFDHGPFLLAEVDAAATPGTHHANIARQTSHDRETLENLQERLRAEASRSVLVVLQGMDTAGKDGTIKHVIGSMDPQGCRVVAFKAPTKEELAHDFLWRIKKALPVAGELTVFNRSHYEDVVIVRVHRLVPEDVWRARYDQINEFEQQLVATGTIIVKIFLHISFDEQRKRLLARLDDPTKHWKFEPADLDERELWDQYVTAYDDVIARCSTDWAPWYIVPADHKHYRDWAVGRLLVEILDEADLRYPDRSLDVEALKRRLR
ncbi:MAG: PPK2 family polyphosphate kinase [Actinomycetota bacterium]